jgi:parvulin-like peptidyl-prolyl isomerase
LDYNELILKKMSGQPRTPARRRAARPFPAAAVAACLALFAGSACGREAGPGRPVLRVEKTDYFNADFRAYLVAAGSEAKGLPSESLSRLFDRFVDEMILLEAARQRGIFLTEEEKKEAEAKPVLDAAPADGAGRAGTVRAGTVRAEDAWNRLLAEKYASLVVRDVRVEDAEILAFYEEHKKDFLVHERAQVSQILVDSEEKAISVLRRLDRAGEAEFRKIAAEESAGPEASKAGVMGVFRQGDLPADMEKIVFSLDEGRTSQVVESAYGFHIFRLDKKFPPALQTEREAAGEIRKRIMARKMKDALAAHLAGLKAALSWQILTENLFFTYQRSDE